MNTNALTLYVANRNYSSWSLRAGLMLRHSGLPFREVVVPLDTPEFAQAIGALGAAGKVPVLVDGARVIWDSLAIGETVHELAGNLLPRDAEARALARSIAAEMHSGFPALRNTWSMNIRARIPGTAPDAARAAELERLASLWTQCRDRYAHAGPWLLGEYSLADAMFTPVATRLRTYGDPLPGALAQGYVQTLLADPHFLEWERAAVAERWTIPKYEVVP